MTSWLDATSPFRNCETDFAIYFCVFSRFSVVSNYTVSMTILCNPLSSHLHMFPYMYTSILNHTLHLLFGFSRVLLYYKVMLIFYSPKFHMTFTCCFQSNCRFFTFSFHKQNSLSLPPCHFHSLPQIYPPPPWPQNSPYVQPPFTSPFKVRITYKTYTSRTRISRAINITFNEWRKSQTPVTTSCKDRKASWKDNSRSSNQKIVCIL
jgi:hypothetical protein